MKYQAQFLQSGKWHESISQEDREVAVANAAKWLSLYRTPGFVDAVRVIEIPDETEATSSDPR